MNDNMSKETNTGHETSEELLKELVSNSRKHLFYTKLAAFVAFVAAAALVVCLVILVPSVVKTVNRANEVMAKASGTIELADTAIASVTEMSNSITVMGNNMDTFITENAESVEQVMKKLDDIDFEGLNSAIKDLGDVVEPLANFFGKFK